MGANGDDMPLKVASLATAASVAWEIAERWRSVLTGAYGRVS